MLAAEGSGVATYARTLVSALAETGERPGILDDATRGRFGRAEPRLAAWRRAMAVRWRHTIVTAEDGRDLFARDLFRFAQAHFMRTGALLRVRAPGPPGIMHWTYPVPAWIDGWANLYTVHDVLPLTHAGLTAMAAAPLRARLTQIATRAARLVTVSAHSRREIIAALAVPDRLVVDCGLATDIAAEHRAAMPGELTSGGYFLFCGSAEPRKNLARVVAAWRMSGATRPLAIAGDAGDATLDLSGTIRLGRLPRPELVETIAAARALVFPSLAEGFGLPIAEAMALGVPVVTTGQGAMAETAGDAALLVDPVDTAAIAASIGRLDRDDALAAGLAARGRGRAGEAFSLRQFGQRLRGLYAEIAGDSRVAP